MVQVAPGIVVKQEPTDYNDEEECDENEDNLLGSCENIEVCRIHLGRGEGVKGFQFWAKSFGWIKQSNNRCRKRKKGTIFTLMKRLNQ